MGNRVWFLLFGSVVGSIVIITFCGENGVGLKGLVIMLSESTPTTIVAQVDDDDMITAYESAGSCSMNDDDDTYLENSYCSGDADVCTTYKEEMEKGTKQSYALAWEECSYACDANETYIVPCLWATISRMDSYCQSKGKFQVDSVANVFPDDSFNHSPDNIYFKLNATSITKKVIDGCNLHAFCHACLDEAREYKKTCLAYVHFYNTLNADGASHFFDQLDFWCADSVQTLIKEGVFVERWNHFGYSDYLQRN